MIVWLASYPKSGNTWIRFFILSLIFGNKSKINLENLKLITQFPKKSQFVNLTNNFQNFDAISKNWISSQEKINSDNKIRFLKTHNMMCCFDNYCFTDINNTLGSIYIVRDPRNVITSLKNHFSFENYEQAKQFIFNEKQAIKPTKYIKNEDFLLETIIGSWQTHYKSWKNIKKNFLLIKYENLINNTKTEFLKLSNFLETILKTKFKEEQIDRAIAESSFENMSAMEKLKGFSESTNNKKTGKKNIFFNLGPKNDWKKILTKEVAAEISLKFKSEMEELGYL